MTSVEIGSTGRFLDLGETISKLPDPQNAKFWGKAGEGGFLDNFMNSSASKELVDFGTTGVKVKRSVLFLHEVSKFADDAGDWALQFGKSPKCYDAWLGLNETAGWARMNEKLLLKLADEPSKITKVNEFYKSGNPKFPEGILDDLRAGVKKLPLKVKKIIDGVEVTVEYDKFGFAKFHPAHVPDMDYIVKIDGMNGTGTDFTAAKNALLKKLKNGDYIEKSTKGGSWSPFKLFDKYGNPKGEYTWHHHQNGKTMIPVKTTVHEKYSHTGGNRIMEDKTPDFRTLFNFFKR